ncbi:MAG: heme exporter protein CcmD [Pseudomonadota bacterium]
MYFDSLSAALHMEGHGVFVWSVCIVAVLVVAALLIVPRRRERAALKTIAGELRRQASRAAEVS